MTLTRRTSLRPKPKGKGNRGERAIVDMCRDFGWTHARRNFASGGQGGADIINGPDGVSLEVKWCERAEIWKWIAQSEAAARPTEIPAVIFKKNHGRWWACAPSDEWEALDQLVDHRRVWTRHVRSEAIRLWKELEEVERVAAGEEPSFAPRLKFSRKASGWYTIGAAEEFFWLLWTRELAT